MAQPCHSDLFALAAAVFLALPGADPTSYLFGLTLQVVRYEMVRYGVLNPLFFAYRPTGRAKLRRRKVLPRKTLEL